MNKILILAAMGLLAGCAKSNEPFFPAGYQPYQPQPMAPVQYPTMAVPQVAPLQRPGGNQVRCIRAGIYTNCRY